eukprot:jgi/Ulvmu1/7710/UM039_0016.1
MNSKSVEMGKSFKDQHVLITGGSQGIGLALARLFIADGAQLTLLARGTGKLLAAQEQLKELCPDGVVHVVSADVTDGHNLRAVLDHVEAQYGQIDIAICNAGRGYSKLLVDQTLEEAQEIMQVNYFGCYNTSHALVPRMLERGSGHISFVCSMIYISPMAGASGYCSTKAAVRHFADSLRSELVGTGVTVSVGYPPDTQTPGLEAENREKAEIVHRLFEQTKEKVHSAESVAKCLYTGMRRGDYHLPTPVLLHRLGLSMVAGATPKPKWSIFEILISPLLALLGICIRMMHDSVVRDWARARPVGKVPAVSVAAVRPDTVGTCDAAALKPKDPTPL